MEKLILTQLTESDIRQMIREEVGGIIQEKIKATSEQDTVSIQEAMKITNLAKQTIYGLVNADKIPYIKKEGHKKLYFSRKRLLNWLNGKRGDEYDR